MRYTTVLWDLDGTILDSGAGVFDCFRRTFAALGVEQPTDETLRTFVGPPLRTTFEKLMGFAPELANRALETYRDFYHSGAALNAHLYEGVVEVIAETRSAGIATSLATSKALAGTIVVGEHFGFIQHFDFLGTADPAQNRHSKAEVVAYAIDGLKQLGANLERVLLVGDRIHDVEGARAHGIDVALVTWGYGSPDEWAQADYIVDSTESLNKLILGNGAQ
jgi:phosphoglycolate phosphatase